MLVVFFGVSCVGKSTIIENLIGHGYLPVRVYTTRQLRKNEKIKVHVSNEMFDQYHSQNKFAWVNCFFNIKYGTSREDISNAISGSKVYLLDYALSRGDDFNGIDCLKIIVLPENLNALMQQVKSANRQERLDEILHDYETNYNHDSISKYLQQGYKVVKNYYSNPQKAIKQIETYITNGGNAWQY